ncbi:energy-coupling factor transport system ATP-binding protein [Cryobacterium mesophilum]|uniref:Energy-coupling factor ABC transporter ATP-binding protein n=1 Tax=Terrimesophilobacter mesophilus TaxID=433647 RepID=A0A4R8V9N4_9MICO|nr:ATP-binding cassette domain-containing protein [Terrimesophilobacter mesophilus]MBB5632400.1 energy-coupling factor transport system ATP-binding protein [Terrimesophilobacter mesophilus]TFB79235.1 energy-coupling factor ABC transporter ATP-binding protein [Terrimesophilobacter mesophilus]
MNSGQDVPAAGVVARGWGWRHAPRKRWAVSDLDLRIEPGERVLLLGASGAGKSTLLQALAGVLGGEDDGEPSGELLVGGKPPAESRGRAGLVLQDPDSQVILAKVGDDVAFGCENLGVPRQEIWPRVREALDAVGLDVALDRSTAALSGGQKQRLALAGVLAMRPGLLLLDEPTANLDPAGVVDVRDAVARVLERTGATLVVVEHRVDVWLPLVDRVVVLSPGGGLLADGSPHAVLTDQGRVLAEAGVWVPGFPPALPARHRASGPDLLLAGDLSVGRGSRVEALVVKADIELTVAAGMTTAITGPNGSGKTTLGFTLAGLLPPLAGVVEATPELRGLQTGRHAGISEHPIRWTSRQLLTRIGTVFQEPEHQFLTATVREELEVGPRALKLPAGEIDARVDELLQRLRLDAVAAANPFTLSGGEKRRLSVATVLATRPRILMLDEPTFGQDARTWAEQVAILAEFVDAGGAVVAATHDRAFVEALADAEVGL